MYQALMIAFVNLLVATVVIRKPKLRTPLTLIEIVNDRWPLGDSEVSCKVTGGLQAVSVFVSTISITAIALDRYQLIVYPTKDLLKRIGAAAALFFIWFLGFLLASPIFMVRTLEHHNLYTPKWTDSVENPVSPGAVHSVDYW